MFPKLSIFRTSEKTPCELQPSSILALLVLFCFVFAMSFNSYMLGPRAGPLVLILMSSSLKQQEAGAPIKVLFNKNFADAWTCNQASQ